MKNSFEFSDVVFCFSSSFRLILILGFSLCVALFHSVGRSVERSVCVCVPFCWMQTRNNRKDGNQRNGKSKNEEKKN